MLLLVVLSRAIVMVGRGIDHIVVAVFVAVSAFLQVLLSLVVLKSLWVPSRTDATWQMLLDIALRLA